MRQSEFFRALEDEFGEYAAVISRELSLTSCGGLTAIEAIEAGFPLREIWLEVCRLQDVPFERQYGVGRIIVESQSS